MCGSVAAPLTCWRRRPEAAGDADLVEAERAQRARGGATARRGELHVVVVVDGVSMVIP